MTNMLYTRAALNTPRGHLPSLDEFLMEDDDINEWKNFEIFQKGTLVSLKTTINFSHQCETSILTNNINYKKLTTLS